MSANHGDAPVELVADSQQPAPEAAEVIFIVGKTASELDAVFQSQSEAIKADPSVKFVRNVHYALVECDKELQRIPLDAFALGLKVQACADDPGALSEDFIFSLLLATGTLNRTTIDVGAECTADPLVVLQEAEAQGLGVRLMLPENATTLESVAEYIERLERYSALWINMGSGNFTLTPLDGYLEYKFALALGHQPKEITSNAEMKLLFTDTVPVEVMDHIKARLDVVIERELGGAEYFEGEIQKMAGALHLKETELREARFKMLEEELDSRTPVPNLIRATSKMTGLSIPDSAGMIYELKNSVHAVLDKYLPKVDGEDLTEYTPSKAQLAFAESLVATLAAGFGGLNGLIAAWEEMSTKSQLKQVIDLDRGAIDPAVGAQLAADAMGVEGKVAALAVAEFTGMLGSILRAGGAISEIGLERPKPVAEPRTSNPSGIIIAVG